jgi:hypothetical protein
VAFLEFLSAAAWTQIIPPELHTLMLPVISLLQTEHHESVFEIA